METHSTFRREHKNDVYRVLCMLHAACVCDAPGYRKDAFGMEWKEERIEAQNLCLDRFYIALCSNCFNERNDDMKGAWRMPSRTHITHIILLHVSSSTYRYSFILVKYSQQLSVGNRFESSRAQNLILKPHLSISMCIRNGTAHATEIKQTRILFFDRRHSAYN